MRKGRYELHDYLYSTFELDMFRGKRVLSIGCGAGIDEIEMAKNGAYVWATDPSDQSLELTRKNADEAGVYLRIEKQDATKLPYHDGFFDHVYAFGVLHHIPRVDDALREIHRVLKKNGTAYAMLYHRDSLLYNYSILYLRGVKEGWFEKGLTEEEVLSRFSEGKEGCPYTRAYTLDEADWLFLKNGLYPYYKGISYNVVDELEQRKVKFYGPPYLGWHLVVKARKEEI
jgi:SAM-dependent methyltransferase